MISIQVTEIPLTPPQTRDLIPTTKWESEVVGYLVEVTTYMTTWQEEFTDPARVRAFIRGVKAGGAAKADHDIQVEPREWDA